MADSKCDERIDLVADALWDVVEETPPGLVKSLYTSVASFLSCLSEDIVGDPNYAADIKEGTLSGLINNIRLDCERYGLKKSKKE